MQSRSTASCVMTTLSSLPTYNIRLDTRRRHTTTTKARQLINHKTYFRTIEFYCLWSSIPLSLSYIFYLRRHSFLAGPHSPCTRSRPFPTHVAHSVVCLCLSLQCVCACVCVCHSVCWAHGARAVQKLLNRSRCHLGQTRVGSEGEVQVPTGRALLKRTGTMQKWVCCDDAALCQMDTCFSERTF